MTAALAIPRKNAALPPRFFSYPHFAEPYAVWNEKLGPGRKIADLRKTRKTMSVTQRIE
jgi:hypothetical protein